MRVFHATAGALAALLIGTALPAHAQEAQDEACAAMRADQMASVVDTDPRRLTETIGVLDCWEADVGNDKHYYLNDLYARWVIEEIGARGTPLVRDYRAETPPFVERIFVGHTRGTVTSVKIKMHDPDIDFTIPLLSVDYNGKVGQGQAFVTNLLTSDMSLPDFRLSPNSSVSIEATSRITNEVDVHATGIVLGTLKDALSIAAPGSSLLTSINREQVQKVSGAYDAALSNLLSRTIAESTTTGRLMSEWYPGASVLVSIDVPAKIRTTGQVLESKKTKATLRRLWFRLTLTCPRLSIFDTVSVCETDGGEDKNLRVLINSPNRKPSGTVNGVVGQPGHDSPQYQAAVTDLAQRVTPHQVLNFRMGDSKSLRQFMTEQEWFISLSKKMVQPDEGVTTIASQVVATEAEGSANTVREQQTLANQRAALSPSTAAAEEFCTAVVEKLYSAGLSQLDSEIGLWAIATGIPDFATSRDIFAAANGCRNRLPGNGWSFVDQAVSN